MYEYFERYKEFFPQIKDERRVTVCCPLHNDTRPSMSIYLDSGVSVCPKCGRFSYKRLCERMGANPHFSDERPIEAEYPYFDADGNEMGTKLRYEGKHFVWKDRKGAVLFNSPEIVKADVVVIVEGEKDALNAEAVNLIEGAAYTCGPDGAGTSFRELHKALIGKHIVLIPDADEAGEGYAQEIARYSHLYKSFKRLTLSGAKDISEWLERGGSVDKFSELLSQARDGALEAADIESIQDVFPSALNEVRAAMQHDGPIGVCTLPSFDNWFYGFERGYTYCLGAKTSMGKTALALTLAKTAADNGHRVLYLCLESSKALLCKRILASVVGIPTTKLRRGLLSEEEMIRVNSARSALPYHIYFAKKLRPQELAHTISVAVDRIGAEFVILDHLMEVQFESGSNENEELKKCVRLLYDLAGEKKYAQLLVAQFNKEGQKKKESSPQMGDTRGSIALDQAVDVMIYLDRPSYGTGAGEEQDEPTKVIVAKDRIEGHTGSFFIKYDRQFTRFVDMPAGWEAPIEGEDA